MSRWPLAVLLELAARGEAAAREALARAIEVEGARRGERDAVAEALRAHAAALAHAEGIPPGRSAASLRGAAHHRARLREERLGMAAALRAREARLAAARDAVRSRRDSLAGACATVSALERHRDRWRASKARMRELAGERVADDLVSVVRRGVW